MRVLFIAAEVSPFAKTGGLADVALSLPRALARKGVEILVVMPKYRGIGARTELAETTRFPVSVAGQARECVAVRGQLPDSVVPIYFLGHDPYFDRPQIYGEGSEYPDAIERFTFLSRGAIALCEALAWTPDVLHANDWHAALVPGYATDRAAPWLEKAKTILTIHNLGYQGAFPADQARATGLSSAALRAYLRDERINLLRGGILLADVINTVSPTYATEILENGAGLEAELRSRRDALYGVVNGVDVDEWNPAADPHLWEPFDVEHLSGKLRNKVRLQQELGLAADPAVPIVAVISRLAEQKGFDLIMRGFDRMMGLGVQFVLLGTGAEEYERFFREVPSRYPGRVASLIMFSEAWAHRIEASADLFLMPSHYEPCGLNQQYSLRYGTVPVVRATGGLKDTVEEYDAKADRGTGFLFEDSTPAAFLDAVGRAVRAFRSDPDAWRRLQGRGMRKDLSWDASADAYLDLYDRALA